MLVPIPDLDDETLGYAGNFLFAEKDSRSPIDFLVGGTLREEIRRRVRDPQAKHASLAVEISALAPPETFQAGFALLSKMILCCRGAILASTSGDHGSATGLLTAANFLADVSLALATASTEELERKKKRGRKWGWN